MSTTCKYCNEPEDKQYRPGLICESCICFVHLTCLKRAGTPGDLSGDVFFDYTCEDCSAEKEEIFKRTKILWVHALLLTLYHLRNHMSGMSNHRYFHYKTHICSFIDRSWMQLFGPKFKQKKNWIGTIAGALSVYSNLLFQSGLAQLGESGWWKLKHNFSPAAAAHIIQEISRDKTKSRPKNQLGVDMTLFIAKVTELGYKDQLVEEEVFTSPNPTPAKKRRLEFEDFLPSDVQDYVKEEKLMSPVKQEVEDYYEASTASISSRDNFSDMDFLKEKFDYPAYIPPINFQSDSSSVHSYKYSYNCDSDSSLRELPSDTEVKKEKTKRTEEKPYIRRESLFSTQLNSVDMPWLSPPEPTNDVVEMTEYEEIQLLKTIEALVLKVRESEKKAYLSQLKAKLALRRLKRHKHIPVFDLDKTVKILGGYVTEDKKIISNIERVLDRFQRSYLIDNLSGTIASTNYGTVLLSSMETAPFRSSYSGATLKPFIRRDNETTPIWLKLMDELLRKTHKHEEAYKPPPRATIDYSYLKPQHIAAVNKLCAQYFWPGIDLTEALQYPEFSCVVTYKKLVIGCAFLVPDVGHNQAYISFVLTRPEWRRANIATFMLYHLLQTCSGQDVTLHVSPTNPAIFLYQKFGFKVEELIQDFYEKYYNMDYKGCRHALFLRLVR
ncbi:cysteine-rich protein 2-binding protein isoform X1 [Pieris brassicae]|uniref:cysteine-rich protein 2-binding protein isoform X1 n=2 Tax=Pieris brassicae TaxID=7116 RepID=UPI001E65FC0D|nr:cysteine-rich protein 2-binding protein isoform X1 [Pieris brassicae]